MPKKYFHIYYFKFKTQLKQDSGLIYDLNQSPIIQIFGKTNTFQEKYTEENIITPLINAHPYRNPLSIEDSKIVRIMH